MPIKEKEKIVKADLAVLKKKIVILEANRQLSSKWTISLDIEIEIRLPDGRLLSAWVDKTIPARQVGRREKKSGKNAQNAD